MKNTNKDQCLYRGSQISKASYDDFVCRLNYHNLGQGRERHITANPLFIVQEKIRICGVSSDYTDKFEYGSTDHGYYKSIEELFNDLDNEQKEELDIRAQSDCENDFLMLDEDDQLELLVDVFDDEIAKIGYIEHWEYVNSHFTPEAANAFIERKKHDYPLGLRVYAKSQHTCWEFNTIISGILNNDVTYKDNLNDYIVFLMPYILKIIGVICITLIIIFSTKIGV